MGLTPTKYEYRDKRAYTAEPWIRAYFIMEAIWLVLWAGVILALELTEQVGFDADSKYELQSTISAMHAIATAGLLFYYRGEYSWLVYLSLCPVLITDTTALLHLIYQVPEASWWSWTLCMVISSFGIFLDVYAIIVVIIAKDVYKVKFDLDTRKRVKINF